MMEEEQELARQIMDRGLFLSKVEFQGVEIQLFRFEGGPIEIWYYFNEERIQIKELRGNPMNPYLKHINQHNLN